MISIACGTESVVINESVKETNYGDILPRISRTATLDGGSVLSMSGCSHSDRTMTLVAKDVAEAIEAVLRRIALQSLVVTLTCSEGVFLGAISSLAVKMREIRITFLVKEKLTQD
jgi:hypothetical protein